MGYYTNFDVEITGFQNEEESEFFEFKEIHKKDASLHFIKYSGYSVNLVILPHSISFNLHQYKWYDWEKDLVNVSKRWPHLMFDINGEGEEATDLWRARIRNGESEIARVKIVFPEFEKILT